ncbi:MAG TPA: SDR family oxidoreductase [Solirubrobacterales bacterium]|nr:SDR family oxidoreductase [Solirubrobacterales bacterium]
MGPPVRSFAGKRCLVTGAASGIGRATALAAARDGAELHLTDVAAGALEETAEEIRAGGGRVGSTTVADLSQHEAVVAMAEQVQTDHGAMDVVMNVAGVSTWGSIERLRHEDWEKMVAVDLMGPISVLECFVPPMIEAGRGGHLVNVSSAAGLLGLPWHAAYSAAKFGLRGVSEVLRFDLRRHGIGVSLVCPGAVRTPLVGTVEIVGVDRDSPRIRAITKRFEERAVSPEEVAARILAAVRRNRYLVFTSRDIQLLFWLQRWLPPVYELAMRQLNRRLVAVMRDRPADDRR